MPSEILRSLGKIVAAKKMKIACAESATAGRLCAELSLLPESGEILLGGLISYDASVKETVLNIPKSIVDQHTAESAEVTALMAERLPNLIKSDIYVAITGLLTPGGSESPEKPVGTVFIHIIVKGHPIAIRRTFAGSPEQIALQTIDEVAKQLTDYLNLA